MLSWIRHCENEGNWVLCIWCLWSPWGTLAGPWEPLKRCPDRRCKGSPEVGLLCMPVNPGDRFQPVVRVGRFRDSRADIWKSKENPEQDSNPKVLQSCKADRTAVQYHKKRPRATLIQNLQLQTGSRCTQTEKELLALLFGMEWYDQFSLEHKIRLASSLITSHWKAIMKKLLLNTPKCLQHILLRFQHNEVRKKHCPGSSWLLDMPSWI